MKLSLQNPQVGTESIVHIDMKIGQIAAVALLVSVVNDALVGPEEVLKGIRGLGFATILYPP